MAEIRTADEDRVCRSASATTDHLGSPRIITDQLGQVKSRRDFMPFGEDLFANVGSRSASNNYSSNGDDIKQKFTGYQKDGETGLDFAEARMYENRHGRFSAVDPLLASGKSANPQSFNRYIYVRNNPALLTDSSGLCDEKTCPKNHYGTVYTRTLNGETFYNDVAPDSSWTVFKGDGEFVRKSTGVRTVVNEFGWYESPIAVGNETVAPLMSGFRTDLFGSLNGLWKGPPNFLITTWNGITDSAINGRGGPYIPGLAPNPLEIPLIPVYSNAESRTMVGGFFGTMFAPYAAAAPFAAGGTLSVVPSGTRVPQFRPGTFSVVDWTGYPEGYARPSGTFRILEGSEYDGARALANATNRAMRSESPAMYRGFQIHEIKPVKFGGSPVDRTNKLILTQPAHARFNTFWMRLQRSLEHK